MDGYQGRRLLSVRQSCEKLGVQRTTFYSILPELQSLQIGRRRLILEDSLDDYIDRLLRGAK